MNESFVVHDELNIYVNLVNSVWTFVKKVLTGRCTRSFTQMLLWKDLIRQPNTVVLIVKTKLFLKMNGALQLFSFIFGDK